MKATGRRRTDGLDGYLLPRRSEATAGAHGFPGYCDRMSRAVQRLFDQVQIVSLDLRNVIPDFGRNHLLSDVRLVVQSEACDTRTAIHFTVCPIFEYLGKRGAKRTIPICTFAI